MSYILEALKKSECERGQGRAPGVQTIHSASLNYRSDKRPVWPYFLITAVALNLAVLVYFILTDENSVPVAVAHQDPQHIAAESGRPQQINTHTEAQPATGYTDHDTAILNSEAEVTHQPAAEQNNAIEPYKRIEVVNIRDLPLNIQQQIPAMSFSAHVYSSNATQRSVVINDRFMEEGEEFMDGIVLSEITRDGIIFDYMGYRISTSVITNWDIN